jgi:type III pantothenate kinase
MLLAVDIGNTNIVFGVNGKGNWMNHWRIQTDQFKMADEYRVIFSALLNDAKINLPKINTVIISSVVPSLVHPFIEMLSELLPQAKINILGPEVYPKLPLKILNPYQIGSDLVANAVAAFHHYGNLTMVIDFGTALTFTTIGKDSEIRGVAIAPGLNTAVGALAGKTAQLPQIHLSAPPSVLGENTVHAIQAGVIYGFSGLVDSIIERTQNELGEPVKVVATGGLSHIIAPLTKNVKIIEPMLTLDGLSLVDKYIKR